jgi:hypothetical protein
MEIYWYGEMDHAVREGGPITLRSEGMVWLVIPTGKDTYKIRRCKKGLAVMVITPLSRKRVLEWVKRLFDEVPWPPGSGSLHLGWSRIEPGRKVRFWAAFGEEGATVCPGDLPEKLKQTFPPPWVKGGLQVGSRERTAYDLLRLG